MEPEHSTIPVDSLESLRLRLTQLAHSLSKLQDALQQPQLPPWKSIQNQFNVILTQLISLTSTLSFHSEILSSTVAYPLPKFPTTAQEGLLTTLLRKKNLPEVDAWLSKAKEESEGLTLRYDDEICNWALTQTEKEREGREFFEFYTRKEVEDGTAEILEKQQQIREKEKGTGAGNNETNGDGFLINQMLGFMYNGEEPKTAQMAQ